MHAVGQRFDPAILHHLFIRSLTLDLYIGLVLDFKSLKFIKLLLLKSTKVKNKFIYF